MIDIGLWAIVTAFWAWEVVAHFVFHNTGMHTLSNRILAFEAKHGTKARVLVGAAIVALFLHLVFHLF